MATSITFSSALFGFFFFFFFSFLFFQTMSQPSEINHLLTFCNESNNFTQHSSYHSNRKSVLTTIRSSSLLGKITYANATKGLSPDTAYAMYLCRGDIDKRICSFCVRTATLEITKSCPYQKETFMFYEECMVRVSDYYFFGLLEKSPNITKYSLSNFSMTSSSGQTFSRKIDKLILKAASMTLWPRPYFVEDKERVTEFGSSYILDTVVQCSSDLAPSNCIACLRLAVQDILDCCSRSRGVQIFLPKCLVRYDTYSLPGNVPSLGVIKGNKIFERTFIAVITASMLVVLGL